MGKTKKTDKLDATRLAILLRNGTLPEVWIPPSELRDQRELLRLRIFLVRLRTQVKNRVHVTLARHNLQIPGTDLFGVEVRSRLGAPLPELPTHSRETVVHELAVLDFLELQIESAEQRLHVIMAASPEADPFKTLPCVGKILSMTLMLEIGRWNVFPQPLIWQLCRAGTPRECERRSHPHGTSLWKREPESKVGLGGG